MGSGNNYNISTNHFMKVIQRLKVKLVETLSKHDSLFQIWIQLLNKTLNFNVRILNKTFIQVTLRIKGQMGEFVTWDLLYLVG